MALATSVTIASLLVIGTLAADKTTAVSFVQVGKNMMASSSAAPRGDLDVAQSNWNAFYGAKIEMLGWQDVATITSDAERDEIVKTVFANPISVMVPVGNLSDPSNTSVESLSDALVDNVTLLSLWHDRVDDIIEVGMRVVTISWNEKLTGVSFITTAAVTGNTSSTDYIIRWDSMLGLVALESSSPFGLQQRARREIPSSGEVTTKFLWLFPRDRAWWEVRCEDQTCSMISCGCEMSWMGGTCDCKHKLHPFDGVGCTMDVAYYLSSQSVVSIGFGALGFTFKIGKQIGYIKKDKTTVKHKCPTPAPTTFPTPPPSVTGVSDPHMVNIRGERFDITHTGRMLFLLAPRGAAPDNASFLVWAKVADMSDDIDGCNMAPYIMEVQLGGLWLGGHSVDVALIMGSMQVHVDDILQSPSTKPVLLGQAVVGDVQLLFIDEDRVNLHVGAAAFDVIRDGMATHFFLNFKAASLGSLGCGLGGLLGDDDHTNVSMVPALCLAHARRLVLAEGTRTPASYSHATASLFH